MQSARYHPLLSVDDDDIEKMPLFSSEDREAVSQRHSLYLAETIPHYYRLCSSYQIARAAWQRYRVHCPRCGESMKPISIPADEYVLPLFCCPRCSRKENTV